MRIHQVLLAVATTTPNGAVHRNKAGTITTTLRAAVNSQTHKKSARTGNDDFSLSPSHKLSTTNSLSSSPPLSFYPCCVLSGIFRLSSSVLGVINCCGSKPDEATRALPEKSFAPNSVASFRCATKAGSLHAYALTNPAQFTLSLGICGSLAWPQTNCWKFKTVCCTTSLHHFNVFFNYSFTLPLSFFARRSTRAFCSVYASSFSSLYYIAIHKLSHHWDIYTSIITFVIIFNVQIILHIKHGRPYHTRSGGT